MRSDALWHAAIKSKDSSIIVQLWTSAMAIFFFLSLSRRRKIGASMDRTSTIRNAIYATPTSGLHFHTRFSALVEWFPTKYGFHHGETCEDKDMSWLPAPSFHQPASSDSVWPSSLAPRVSLGLSPLSFFSIFLSSSTVVRNWTCVEFRTSGGYEELPTCPDS